MSDTERSNIIKGSNITNDLAFLTGGYSIDRMIKIALDLSAEKNFDNLMQKILLEAMDICHCDAGTVYVLEDDYLHFHTVYTRSLGIPMAEQSRNANLPPVKLSRKNVWGSKVRCHNPLPHRIHACNADER